MGSKIFILVVIILGVLAIAQIVRVSELMSKHSNKKPEEIPQRENMFNARMFLVFVILLFTSYIWLLLDYGHLNLGPSASAHGNEVDMLFNINWFIISTIFFVTNGALFFFAFKYVRKPGRKAYYYTHNAKLELLWTAIPSAVLTVIVIMGLKVWNDVTAQAGKEYVDIEIFSYQFAWTARYSGMNNELGKFDYKLTTAENPYAIKTRENIEKSLSLMKVGSPGAEGVEMLEKELRNDSIVMSAEDRSDLEDELDRKERMSKFLDGMLATYKDSLDELANDDVILEDSLVLLKGQKYNLNFRSKDVIHSAYFPQFRIQMNTVPGMTTYFKFQPIISSAEMKVKLDDPDYEYALLCNKVCGGSHYKMKMSVVVLGPKKFLQWQKTKSTYDGTPWIEGNEKELLEYYEGITNSVEE